MSHLTQLIALGAVGMAGLTLIKRVPRLHLAVLSYAALIAFWSLTVRSEDWPGYISLVKLTVMAFALHLVIRTPRHLLLLLGIYCLSGAIALLLNWGEIREVRHMMDAGAVSTERMRLDGTFQNANRAGVFAAAVTVSGLIVFFNVRHRVRWLVLACGVGSGLIIGGLSGSRMGMLGMLIAGFAAPLMATAGDSRNLLVKGVKAAALAVVAGALLLGTLSQLPQFERLTRLTEGAAADGSTATRWGMAQASLKVWAQYPIAGAGYRGFERVSEFPGRPSHTTFGEIIANAGLVGVILIGIFYGLPALHLLRFTRHGRNEDLRRLAVGLMVFAAVFFACSIFAILHTSKDLIPLWAAICGVIQEQRSHHRRFSAPPPSLSHSAISHRSKSRRRHSITHPHNGRSPDRFRQTTG
jgi:O-antigen ligase